jgi:uncharacterized membrane protein YdbT with pleckstrin-like domain
MSYVDDNLLPGERVVYRARLHPIIYSWAIVLAIVGLAAAAFGLLADSMVWVSWAGAAVLLVAAILFAVSLVKSSSSEFAVTNRRVVIKVGVVRRHTVELLLQQVEGIGVDQSVIGRLLNLGSIVVIGTGGTKEQFTNIANPLEFRHQVQAQTAGIYDASVPASAAPMAPGGTYCSACGTQSPQAASFCYHCGQKLVAQ